MPSSSSSSAVTRPHSLNIFSAETTGKTKAKFHMEPLWEGARNDCLNVPGHMTHKNIGYKVRPDSNDRCHWNLNTALDTEVVQMTIQG